MTVQNLYASWYDRDGVDRAEWLRFWDNHVGAPLLLTEPELGSPFRVHLPSSELGQWYVGTTQVDRPEFPVLSVEFGDQTVRIQPGNSGAPLFDDFGRVIGVLSDGSLDEPHAHCVRLATALPRRVTLVEEWTEGE